VARYLFLGFVYLNILLPVLFILVYSLNDARFFVLPVQGWSTKWYVQALTGGRFLEGLAVSLEVAIAATILSAVTGTLASIALVRGGIPGATAISQLLLSPLIIPAIPLGLGLLILFTQVSVVTGYRFAGTYWSLVVGHAVISMPWVMRLTIAGLQVADRTLEEAAANLGASPLRTYWHITLPLLRPGIVAGSIFAFVTSFSEVNMSLFLVGPQMTTLPISILNYVGFRTDPSVAAISTVVILLTTGVILAADRIVGLNNVY
jgi:putative spermidine/putrescine transport system permease protein